MGSSGDECAAIVPSPWAAGAGRRPPGTGRLISERRIVDGSGERGAARALPRLRSLDSPLLEELREPRILPETDERGVDAQEVRLLVAELERCGEPRERLVVVAVERVNAGGVVRRAGISRARFGRFHGAGDPVLSLLSDSHVLSRGLEVA